jgi:hypothetical protein
VAANVAGLFHVSMEVLDHSGTCLTQITIRTRGARHVVHVENISTLTRDARVVAVLPHGTTRLEFVVSGAVQTQWDKHVLRIPSGKKRDLECDLRRNTGSAHRNEPLQCDQVYDKRSSLPWTSLTPGVPFQMTIDAA